MFPWFIALAGRPAAPRQCRGGRVAVQPSWGSLAGRVSLCQGKLVSYWQCLLIFINIGVNVHRQKNPQRFLGGYPVV